MEELVYLDQCTNNIIDKIYENNTICKLLYYNTPDALIYPDLSDNTILYTDLDDRKIYPWAYTGENITDEKTMLYVGLFNARLGQRKIYYKDIIMEITILSHIRLNELTTDTPGKAKLRLNRLTHEISKLLHNQKIFGIGVMLFDFQEKISIDKMYSGYKLYFKVSDFSGNG